MEFNQGSENVFVTQYNYASKYALRDSILKHLSAEPSGKANFEKLLGEPVKRIKEDLLLMKLRGELAHWENLTAIISEHGKNFWDQRGYKGLLVQSDNEIVFQILYDHHGTPVAYDEIEETSGLDAVSIREIIDETRSGIVYSNDEGEVGIRQESLGYVKTVLMNKQFDKLKHKPTEHASTTKYEIHDNSKHFSNISGQIVEGGAHDSSVTQNEPKKDGFWEKSNTKITMIGGLLLIVTYFFTIGKDLESCNIIKKNTGSATSRVLDTTAANPK